MTLKKDRLYLKSLTPEAYYSEGFFQINTRPPICGGNFSKYLDAPGQSRHDWQLEQRQSPYVLTFKDAKDNSFYILKGWWRFSEVWCSDYWKVPVKYLLWPPGKTLPPRSQHHFQEEGNLLIPSQGTFFWKSARLPSSLPVDRGKGNSECTPVHFFVNSRVATKRKALSLIVYPSKIRSLPRIF